MRYKTALRGEAVLLSDYWGGVNHRHSHAGLYKPRLTTRVRAGVILAQPALAGEAFFMCRRSRLSWGAKRPLSCLSLSSTLGISVYYAGSILFLIYSSLIFGSFLDAALGILCVPGRSTQ